MDFGILFLLSDIDEKFLCFSQTIDEYLQLPRSDCDNDFDVTDDTIDIPQTSVSRIVLDGSDSGSDSGISGKSLFSMFLILSILSKMSYLLLKNEIS